MTPDKDVAAGARFGAADAEELWSARFGAEARAHPIASEIDAVFRIEANGVNYLLRVTDAREGLADLQIAVLDAIATRAPDLPVPRVHRAAAGEAIVDVPFRGGAPLVGFATTFLPGSPLQGFGPSPDTFQATFTTLARLDRALEDFSHPRARRALIWDVSNADYVLPLIESIPDAVLRGEAEHALLDWRARAAPVLKTLPVQAIHNDFNPSNILLDETGKISGIIDFGDVIAAPRVCDLATAIAYQPFDGSVGALLATAVAAYEQSIPLTAPERAILPVLVRARAAMVVTVTHWRAAHNPANRAYLLRNAPIGARLLRAFAGE